MTQDEKDDFMKHIKNFFDGAKPDDIEWMAFGLKHKDGRIVLATRDAPKSMKLCG